MSSDESVAWPGYVDFLSSFVFVLMLFLASTVYIVTGAIDEQLAQERVNAVGGRLSQGGIANTIEGKRIRISLRNQVSFRVGDTALDDVGRAYLRRIGAQINANPGFKRIVVEGHADKLEVRNDEFGNWRYSVDRAMEVLRFLYSCTDCGFDIRDIRSKLVLRGEGDLDAQILDTPEVRSGRAEDRRVDVILDFGQESGI